MNDVGSKSPNRKGKPPSEVAGVSHVVTGRIIQENGSGVGGLLVEALDIRGRDQTVRLSSTAVEPQGTFSMSLPVEIASAAKPINLRLRVFAPDQPGVERKQRLLFETEVRDHAAPREHFIIELTQKSIERAGLARGRPARTGRIEPAAAAADNARRAALRKADEEAFETQLTEVKERRDLFRENIRSALEESMSTVTPQERQRGRFVPTPDDIPTISENAIKMDLGVLLGQRDPEAGGRAPVERVARLLLTEGQIAKLPGGGTQPVEITEAELEELLEVSMDKPASIFRRSLVDDPCRPKTEAEACLDGEDHHHEPETPVDPEEEEEGSASTYSSRKAIDALMERQASPEDPLIFGPGLHEEDQLLEPVLKADGISSAIAKLTFAPGPAEVPAVHFFNDLQVAFEPIWQEALDDRFLKDVEAAYDKFVERGGAPAVNRIKSLLGLSGVLNPNIFLNELLDIGTVTDTAYDNVASVVIITREEWNALPAPAKTYLSQISAQMAQLRTDIVESIDGSMSPLELLLAGGSTSSLIKAGLAPFLSPTTIELRAKLQLLKSDAEGIVALARRLVLEVEAGRPFRPTHTIIEELKQQHSKAYPFRHFAASSRYRSVNFGLLVTYKQIWTLKAYQVGELVGTIPMAPDEERKYSRRTVRKTKRAVQEVESLYERRTGETESRSRVEAEIIHRATAKTNFSMSSTGTVSYGAGGGGGGGGEQSSGGGMGVSGSNTTTFSRDVEKHSSAVKKEFNESIRKATDEIKNERKTEITTEDTFEEEVTQSGVLKNPNNQITCTYLLYELERLIGIEEKLHGLQSVALVAMEVPAPSELTYAWLIRHDWILSRVLLDPSYAPALGYVSTTLISDDVTLREMREALFRQRKLVEELKQDLADRRVLAGLRYAALQKQIERTAESSEGGGGLFGDIVGGIGKIAGGVPIVGDIVEGALDMITGEGQVSQADQLREGAARDAYEREQREEQDLASRMLSATSTLETMQRDYTDRLSRHLSQLGQVHRLIDHIWQNILYYMQAIWAHIPDDQLFLILKDVPVPVFEKDKSKTIKINPAVHAAATDLSAIDTKWVHAKSGLGIKQPPVSEADKIKTVPLSQVANIYKRLGCWANFLIFPMFEANPITDFMMEPYVKLAEGEYGISDPDPIGNMTLSEFADYVCCLKKHYEEQDRPEVFEKLKPELQEALRKLLQSSRRDEDIVIPCEDGLYIEALPGTHSVMEQFKQLHRIIDVKSAQADLRTKELNNIRRAEMILNEDLADPDIESVKNVYYNGPAPHDGDE
ncbi:hypothetical protein FHR70_003887 [Microvirga lupini]|uniref:Uncharacterized protein n=1 Tax=Microvirga lupini TaxID=420324 RepID=A0A7W4VP84_9HYPH|nr:hypothetical protein [Microvirga lupini]MBB3020799.1 hypothetical protein [Microvirga lupini]